MPFISSKLILILKLTQLLCIEKNGKTLNLLKASSKKINPKKKRKVVPIFGSIKMYHEAT